METCGPSGAAGGEHRLDTRPVGHATLEDGVELVDVLAHELRHVAQRGHECLAARELHGNELELPFALDVDLVWSVDHDLAYRRVLEIQPDGVEELEDRFLEDFTRNEVGAAAHGFDSSLVSEARASSACAPVGAKRRYSLN